MTWLIDGRNLAKKVKNALQYNSDKVQKVKLCIECPSCGHAFAANDATKEWQGLPAGVKFDPTDKEILDHLAAKIGSERLIPHPFIDEFIPTLSGEDGICHTHPENLPGVKHDGMCSHFFHQPTNAYTTGTRKRRKIQSIGDDVQADTRWHKTGKTRSIFQNGKQIGYKKIMVLYTNFSKKSKPQKTSWIMHQYHLGADEDEKEGEFVVSKVFYQTQPRQFNGEKKDDGYQDDESDILANDVLQRKPINPEFDSAENAEAYEAYCTKGMPLTPKLYTPFRPQRDMKTSMDSIATSFIEQMVPLAFHLEKKENLRTCELNGYEVIHGNANDPEIQTDNFCKPPKPKHSWKDEDRSNCIISDLFCEEKLNFNPSSTLSLVVNASQDLLDLAADSGLPLHEHCTDHFYATQKCSLDDVDLDTPPDFLADIVVGSQDSLEWLGKKCFVKQ